MELLRLVNSNEIAPDIEQLFDDEKRKLTELLPSANIEHVGGTAVAGLLTKGDLDINVRVEREEFADAIEKLKSRYEINQPHNWTSTYASFKDDSRDIGIQLTIKNSPDDYFIFQRNYLNNNPDAREKLNRLKKEFEGKDMEAYRDAKNRFFEKLMQHQRKFYFIYGVSGAGDEIFAGDVAGRAVRYS